MRSFLKLSLLFSLIFYVRGKEVDAVASNEGSSVDSDRRGLQQWFNSETFERDNPSFDNGENAVSDQRDLQDLFPPDDPNEYIDSPAYSPSYFDYSPAYWSPAYSPAWSPAYSPAWSPAYSPNWSPTTVATPTLSPTIRPATSTPVEPPPTTSSPSPQPSPRPTIQDSSPEPTKGTTGSPTIQARNPAATNLPTRSPTKLPTRSPTKPPTRSPTKPPTRSPTKPPSPSPSPTKQSVSVTTSSPTPLATTARQTTAAPSEKPRSNWDPTQPPTKQPTLQPTTASGPAQDVSVRTNPFIVTFAGAFDIDLDGGMIFSLTQVNLYLYMSFELGEIVQDVRVTVLATQVDDGKSVLSDSKSALSSTGRMVHTLMTATLDLKGDSSALSVMTEDLATEKVAGFFNGESLENLRSVLINEGIQIDSIWLNQDENIGLLNEDSSPDNDSSNWRKPLLIALVSICGSVFVVVCGFCFLEYRRQKKIEKLLDYSMNGDWTNLKSSPSASSVDPGTKSTTRKTKLRKAIAKFTKEVRHLSPYKRRSLPNATGSAASRRSNLSPYLEENEFSGNASIENGEQESVTYNGQTWETEESSDLLAVAELVGASAAARDVAASDIRASKYSGSAKSRWSRSLTQQLDESSSYESDEDRAVYLVPLDDNELDT